METNGLTERIRDRLDYELTRRSDNVMDISTGLIQAYQLGRIADALEKLAEAGVHRIEAETPAEPVKSIDDAIGDTEPVPKKRKKSFKEE